MISDKVSQEDREALGVKETIKILVTEGMVPYLERHRENFEKGLSAT